MSNTLREIAIENSTKSDMVDSILESTSILPTIPYQEATHQFSNVYPELQEVTGGSFVDANAGLPTMEVTSKLGQTDLGIIGGTHKVRKQTADAFGGASSYFAKKEPYFLKQTGINSEKHIYYNVMEKYCVDNSLYQKTAATTGNAYSMVAVRWEEDSATGLYSPVGMRTDGEMLQREALYNGGLGIVGQDTSGNDVSGYALEYRGYFGLQFVGNKNISAIFNIQSGKLPTEKQIDDMLLNVRANGSTIIYMAPQVLNLLKTYKTDSVQYMNSDNDINRGFMTWDGIRIVTSYNLTEQAFKTLA